MSDKKNYHTIRYGTADGEIKFGHITKDNEISGVMLRAGRDVKHYITLDNTGGDNEKVFRKHGTICRSPGSFQVKAGDNIERDKNIPGIFLDAVSGDIVIRAVKGKIRLEAIDIEMVATGEDNTKGNISLSANEKIIQKAQTIDVSSKTSTKIFSDKTVELIGNGFLNFYGGLIDAADGATQVNGSQTKSSNEDRARSSFK